MTAHLGVRVSALLDGQMSLEESERAWAHVHACYSCRDLVEREGWVKTRLACLSFDPGEASAHLKGSLISMPPGDLILAMAHASGGGTATSRTRRTVGFSALGGGAVGCAVMGVLALGAAPADAPMIDRQTPVTQIDRPSPSLSPTRAPTPSPMLSPTSRP